MDGIDLTYGLVNDRLSRAAPDDLSLLAGEYPFDPRLTGIFLKNNNNSRGIVAAIRVEGASTARVDSLDRTVSQPRWPLRFEARVAPGSVLLVAPSEVHVFKSVTAGPNNSADVETVSQRVVVEGAYYRDPPYPDDPAPQTFVRVYTVPILNAEPDSDALELMVNLHNSRGVTLTAAPAANEGDLHQGTVLPGLQQLWDQAADSQAWKVVAAKFFP